MKKHGLACERVGSRGGSFKRPVGDNPVGDNKSGF